MRHSVLFMPAGGGWWRLCADIDTQTQVYGYDVELRGADGSLIAHLRTDGSLFVAKGYVHDGASGPAIDTDNVLLASLVHDVLYAFGRRLWLPWAARAAADLTYLRLLLKAGVHRLRAKAHWLGVRVGGRRSFGLFAHLWACL